MEVAVPRAFIIDWDATEKRPRFLIRNNCWELYEDIRNSLPPLGIGVNEEAPEILLDLANTFGTTASVTVGWIEIRLAFFAAAIWAVLKRISVIPYQIVSYPGTFGKAVFGSTTFGRGGTYEIEPVE